MLTNDRVERKISCLAGRLRCGRGRFLAVRQIQILGANDAVHRFKQRGFKDRGQFTHIAGPGVLQQARQRARSERDGTLLIAVADSVQQRLGEWGDVFSAKTQRWNGEADGAEAEREIYPKQVVEYAYRRNRTR